MKHIKITTFFAVLLFATTLYAQNETSTPYQRQNSLEVERRLLRLERSVIDLANDVAGILPMANGGTGTALEAPTQDSSVYYDYSEETVSWMSYSDDFTITSGSLTLASSPLYYAELDDAGPDTTSLTAGVEMGSTTVSVPSGTYILRLKGVIQSSSAASNTGGYIYATLDGVTIGTIGGNYSDTVEHTINENDVRDKKFVVVSDLSSVAYTLRCRTTFATINATCSTAESFFYKIGE